MSYNTRRSGGFGGNQPPPQQSVGSIGQRRPVVTNNFVPGSQLTPQNKPGGQIPPNPQLRPPHQQPPPQQQQQQQGQNQNVNTSINFRNQQPPQNQGYQQQQMPPQQQPVQQPQVQQQQVKPEPQTPSKNVIQGANPPNPELENTNGEVMDTSTDDQQTPKKRPFWWRSGNKISKKEKMRRRNVRLSKILQPKNAVMILNELVKNTSYMVEELSTKVDLNQFRATVLVEEKEHVGLGRSKIHAKNSAAEAALRNFIKTNQFAEMTKDEEGNEQMEVTETSTKPLPWQHVASFALFKLFSSWGEDPNNIKTNKIPAQLGFGVPTEKQHENKPAKKMPLNPETMNPLMLLNQMLPHAQFEEIGKSGNPPNVTYSFRCNIDGQSFVGTGPNKKAAKKQAAFGACHKILEISYPTDVYVPIY